MSNDKQFDEIQEKILAVQHTFSKLTDNYRTIIQEAMEEVDAEVMIEADYVMLDDDPELIFQNARLLRRGTIYEFVGEHIETVTIPTDIIHSDIQKYIPNDVYKVMVANDQRAIEKMTDYKAKKYGTTTPDELLKYGSQFAPHLTYMYTKGVSIVSKLILSVLWFCTLTFIKPGVKLQYFKKGVYDTGKRRVSSLILTESHKFDILDESYVTNQIKNIT